MNTGRLTRSLLGSLLAMVSAFQVGAETRLTAPRPVVWRDFLGVNAHFLWFKPEAYQRQMERLEKLGLAWVRVDLHWAAHEPSKGKFLTEPIDGVVAALQARHLHSVFYLVGSAPFATRAPFFLPYQDQFPPKDPEVFAQRMGMLAKRYPHVDAWQVWNEPNLPGFWRPFASPTEYGKLLLSSVRVLNKEVPGKTVVMAGMAYYSQMPVRGGLMLEELGKLGAFNLGTVVAYHPYSLHPEGDDPKAQDFVLRTREVNQRLRGIKVPAIWATEWGWSSYAGPQEEQPVIGREGQADYLLRRLALMSAMDFDRIFLFALSDLDNRAGVRDRSYGLLDLEGKPKPAYVALERFLSICGPRLLPAPGPKVLREAKGQYSIAWTRPDGSHLWMFWAEEGGPIELEGPRSATLHQPLTGGRQTVETQKGPLRLQASRQLQILEWR